MGGFAHLGNTKSEGVHLFDLELTEILAGYYATFVDPETNELNVMNFDPTCERETLSDKTISKDKKKLFATIKNQVIKTIQARLLVNLKGQFARWWANKITSGALQGAGKTIAGIT